MSRHGECAEITTLQRKIPDLSNITDPQTFIAFMEKKGHNVIVKDLYSNERKEIQGMVFDVRIPSEGLSLLFVKGIICKEFIYRKRFSE